MWATNGHTRLLLMATGCRTQVQLQRPTIMSCTVLATSGYQQSALLLQHVLQGCPASAQLPRSPALNPHAKLALMAYHSSRIICYCDLCCQCPLSSLISSIALTVCAAAQCTCGQLCSTLPLQAVVASEAKNDILSTPPVPAVTGQLQATSAELPLMLPVIRLQVPCHCMNW
jgi:hypothetical protein